MQYIHSKQIFTLVLLGFFLLSLAALPAWAEADQDTLIIYYSRTGNSALVSKTLQAELDADLLQIKDLKERSGLWGFIGAAIDSYYNKDTSIEPEHIDVSPYSYIILVSPIWNWKISVPIRTLIHNHRFEDKKLIAFTTANIDIKKYAHYNDDAPFIKRFLRDYLNKKRQEMIALVQGTGAEITGHFHLATKGKTHEEIVEDALEVLYKNYWGVTE